MVDATATEETTGEGATPRQEAVGRQNVLTGQKDLLRQSLKDIYPANPPRAAFLSGMATQLLENESLADLRLSSSEEELLETMKGRRRLIYTGLNLRHDPQLTHPSFDLERAVNKVTQWQKLTPDQTALILKGYILDEICHSPKVAFDGMEMLAARTGQPIEKVIEGFRPFIEQVRETGEEAGKKQIAGTLKTDEYPFHSWPDAYVGEMDNLMRLRGDYRFDEQAGHYKLPQEGRTA